MNKKSGSTKTAGIVIVAALLTVAALMSVFWAASSGGYRDNIVLPEAGGASDSATEEEPEEALFVAIDRENVQQVLRYMVRPEAYHQRLTLTSVWEDGEATETVELWCSGELMRARIDRQTRVQHLLTDGETLWLWYEGDVEARSLRHGEDVSFDDLVGIPTYEALTQLDAETILEAGFVTMNDGGEPVDCLYIAVRDGDYEDRYWVETETQLLHRADSFRNGHQTYQLRQSSRETISAGDATLEDIFSLPDGTVIAE